MLQIARELGCSQNKIAYWMEKHEINRRSVSEAVYTRHNQFGDPFQLRRITTLQEAQLMGIGIGLYWGEGTKRSRHSVRLGNTDPGLLRIFIRFLTELCGIDKTRLRFGLQIFTDLESEDVIGFWANALEIDRSQFMKPVITPSGSLGTYTHKSEHGVLTVMFHNYKIRDIIVELCRDSSVGRAQLW